MELLRSLRRGLTAFAVGLVFMAGTLLGLVYATIVLAFPGSNRVYYGTFFGGMALAIAGPLLWWRSTRDDRPARWIALYLVAWGALIAFLRHS